MLIAEKMFGYELRHYATLIVCVLACVQLYDVYGSKHRHHRHAVHHDKNVCQYGTVRFSLTLYGHTKTAEQRTIIQQYGDRYTGR